VKILVDTHVFVWAIMGERKLSTKHRALWLDPDSELYLSVASVWEMLIKVGTGKLRLPTPSASFILKQMEINRVAQLNIRAAHFAELEALPPLHRDPFDRLLVAQARAEKMPIASVDKQFRNYGVKIL
jgi:PIN domain nuclease of toxin-antitoxin system